MFKIDPNGNIENQITCIAHDLFSKYELIVNEIAYDLSEIEFYYFVEGKHEDPYAHKDEMQKTKCQWYFHGSGIDLTLGDGKNYGGILIRGIYSQSYGEFFSGPLRVAKELFKQFGDISFKEMQFGLKERQYIRQLGDKDFVSSTRINLPYRVDKYNYKDKPYRFLTHIGSKHGFVEKGKVAKALEAVKIPVGTINDIFGYKILKLKG